MNKITNLMVSNRHRKRRLSMLSAFTMTMVMALFAQFAQAQQNVYMHTGSRTLVGSETVNFYDSGGESSGPAYYWERWFSRNEDYTFTFKPETGKRIKVTFKQFTAYTDNNGANDAHAFTTHEDWSLRLNTAELSIYDGLTTDAENLITTYTGSVINEFTVIAEGAMTFHFKSYGFREEGWYAEVEQVEAYAIQKPSISFEVCSDDVVLNANNSNATLYYTTDGNDPVVDDPLTGATLYEGPFHVALNTTVKAVAVVDGTASAVASLKYSRDDVTPTPGLATVTREGNTIIMTPAPLVGDINETYEVWYKIGEDGALQQYTEPFEWSTPRTTFYVYTRAQSCSDKMSAAVTLDFDKVQVPDPTITFTVTDQNTGQGTVQINCPSGFVLSYTTDGSNPEPNTSANSNSVTLTDVAPGTTIKAIAFKITNGALDPDYQESDIITLLCLPGGEGGSGTYGDIVILDDREDHSWSYYSDGSVDNLHKLNPIDVKITYFGNGQDDNNMTTTDTDQIPATYGAKATGVQVNVNEPGNQFIYLKTLEATNADGSGNYPYTMIANPFQVRPLYNPSRGEGSLDNSSISSVVRDSNGNIVAQGAGANATKTCTANVTHQGNMDRGNQTMALGPGRSIMSTRGLTPVTSLSVGSTYVIANGNYAMGNTTYGSSGALYSVSFNSSDSPSDAILWTIESGNATNGYIFKNVGNNKYLGLNSNEYLDVVTSGTAMRYDGTDLINNVDSQGYYYVALSEDNAYFTTSTGSGQNIVIYEYTPDAGTTVWVPTTTITPNEEYLIGFEYNGNVYLAVNYCTTETNHYYTNSNTTYYGYTALAARDGNGYVTGVSGYASDLKYCTWKFSTTSGGTITSGYESTRYLYGWTSSTSYYDLYPNTSSTTWTYNSSTGRLVANSSYYADYYSLSNQPHMRVTSNPSATVRLYSKQTVAVPCTVTAEKGSNISTAYVAEGQTFPSGTTTTTLSNVLSGSYVTFQATVNSNCAFSGWYNGTQLVSTANPYTCVVSGDLTLTAQAVPTYMVTADKGDGISTAYVAEGNSFSGTATSVTVAQGGSATFQATVANGYVFDGWYDQSNQRVSANTTYTITNVQGNTTLTAKGTTSYNITVNVTGGGTVTASPNPATAGQTITLTINANSGYNLTNLTVINNATGAVIPLSGSGNSRTFEMPASTVTVNAVFVDPTDLYRGFYAWRVKRLSSGLSITDSDGNSYGQGSTIYADQEIQFVAEGNSTDNEVEFEALWAKAYFNSSSYFENGTGQYANYKNAYERNFKQVTSLETYNYPVTISSIAPNGGTVGSVTRTSNYSCSNDVKLENMNLNMSSYSLNGNNHSLHIGRGVSNGNSNVAATVYGYNGASGNNVNAFNLRIESGRYTNVYLFNNSSSTGVSAARTWNMIFGSDYDRANNEDNDKLTITGAAEVALYTYCSSSSAKINVTALSGTFGSTGNNTELYMGFENAGTAAQAKRTLEVFGGNFLGGIAGGIEGGQVTATTEVLRMRIRGGEIHQYLYGSGQHSTAYGSRTTVITGGDFDAWISGGCYGTSGSSSDNSGKTYGDTYLYFGGNANQTNTDGIFGAGYGVENTQNDYYIVNKSYVVVADDASTAGNVFGGGNNGYNTSDANVYVLGGGNEGLTVAGSVFGGANKARSEATTNVTMKAGTVTGSLYGGANESGQVADTATVSVSGGTVTNVYGGGLGTGTNMAAGTKVTVSGGTINNNVYGGGALGTTDVNTDVTVSGGTVNDVFGAGMGQGTNYANVNGNTNVSVSGGTVNGSVYGGGENGTVEAEAVAQTKNVVVTIFGNHNQYQENRRAYLTIAIPGQTSQTIRWPRTGNTNAGQSTTISVPCDQTITVTFNFNNYYAPTGLTYNVKSQDGTITYINKTSQPANGTSDNFTVASDPVASNVTSTVNVSGGNIAVDVFGGGKMGTTAGNTFVNVSGGNIRGSVFGGAYGSPNKVYVAGQHSVNIMGGRVFSNVYGGSRNADDALVFTGYSTTETETSSVVNISAGQIDQQVYAAGYYGKTFGSVYVFVGTEAILKAPHKNPSFGDDNETKYKAGNLRIADNIWAGGDWGTFTGGSFGAATVSGYSNIYVNGDGYNTVTASESAPTYMNIGGSILGSGTSCDAGTQGRTIMVSNYGQPISSGSKNDNFPEPYTEATRTLYSIQRADTLILDNAHINFVGLAKVNSIEATEKYAIYSFDKTVRIVGGSSLFMNAVTSQIIDFWSASCDDIYVANATYTPVAYNEVSSTPNKIRVNGGNYIEIYHDKMINGTTAGYGMLNGFAYMMVSENTSDNTCAYARPKQCQDTPIDNDLDNPTDGGWVSYDSDKNTYDINGNSHIDENVTSLGALVQMPYENHKNPPTSKNGEQYFRIWRAGGKYSEREAVINILADGSNTYGVATVTVKLPAWKTASSYYVFQSTSADGINYNTTVNYGADLKTYNSAYSDEAGTSWIHYENDAMATGSVQSALNEISGQPNVNYGLVTAAGTAMSGNPLIVCGESDAFLAKRTNGSIVNRFTCGDFEKNPEVTFLLTYSNLISTNMSWDPMYVTLVQLDENGNEIDIVKIAIIVNTATTIDREFTTQVYAVMNGTGSPHDEYVAKVTLPTFELFDPTAAHASQFIVENVVFTPEASDASQDSWMYKGSSFNAVNKFAMEIGGSTNEDNSDGWNGTSTGMKDSKTCTQENDSLLGESSGRTPFAIDFRMTYDATQTYTGNEPFLGTLTFTITYDNVKVEGETTAQTKTLTIHVQVYRRGTGNAFYLDGQNGSNGYDGRNPDRAALSLSTIFNRLGFMAGDVIYVVNTVDVATDLDWIGTRYDHVVIYRYPGNHQLATDEGIIDNEENEAFVGPLVNVKEKGKMTMRDIYLDGHDEEHNCPNPIASKEDEEPVIDAAVTAESPLATIASGGTLTLTSGAKLQHNTSTSNGGAVVVNDGGTLMMNENATIHDNTIQGEANNGGGVYMNGTIIASDNVKIENNKKATADNNLYLTTADKVLTIGTSVSTDDFEGLTEDAHIGVTKTASDDDGWYRVVNVESDSDIDWLEVPYGVRPNDIVYHDGQKFQLEKHTSPLYLYWVGTWVTMQDWNPTYDSADDPDYDPDDMDVTDITSREQLAWLISMVNGSNGATANNFSGKIININADLNMEEYIWVPIGTDQTPFKGTFEGNGHIITGIRTPLVNNDAGLMGYTEGATIQDVIVNVNFTGNSINQGAIIGEMNGGTLCNAEAAGTMNGSENTVNMGGLVGLVSAGTVHSSFAVNDMTATETTTVVGGLVGTNGGNLYNSYANTTMSGADTIGGLVGVNKAGCTVENCYVILGENTFPAFAYTNKGTITICYADKGDNYVSANVTGNVAPTYSGTYGAVLGRKALGYMYGDNLIDKGTNTYVGNNSVTDEGGLTTYIDKHTPVWNGLLSALNQWVRGHQNQGYSSWNRPTSADINGDLPILAFPKDNSLGTTNGKFLVYSAFDREDLANHNGLDNLLGTIYNGQAANIFLYDSTRNVVSGTGNNKLFIHEDAALLQAASSKAEIKAVVGVTFDNSCKNADDYFGNTLAYDWHLMSTPLSNAQLGISYNDNDNNWWENEDQGQVDDVENSYMPDHINGQSTVKWDFYTYYEPEYHWINFKRNSDSHYHYDENGTTGEHDQIDYENETNLVKGKGYMMAISQDSYMSNNGTLNNGDVPIKLTMSGTLPEEETPSKDWGSNLVGNPYQAYLDLNIVASENGMNTSREGFYVYDADNGVYGPYMTNASENFAIPSQYIHPHQAFFVVTTTEKPNFKFTYDMATATSNGTSFFRGGTQPRYPLVNIYVENERGNRDLAVIEFNRPVLDGVRKVNNLRNANFKVSGHLDGQDFGLMFTPEGTERVPVHFRTTEDGTFTMQWQTMHGTFTSLILVDNLTGTRTDMLRNDHYTFNGSVDDYAARFYITYNVTDVDEINGNGDAFAWFDGYDWIVNGKGQLEVVDMTGRVLYSQRVNGEQVRLHLDGYAAGVYMLRLSGNKNVKAQKIVVK